ncbi:response regulator transcription factor [Pseudoalteromonas sp. MEBiC 03607]|uniref:response regulator transcription factor n=1 Tax=Pseudoalteromonas sp. MEBiC 03607 TaxID=2563601 RepID=UPI001093DA83|nr:response regulator transcription factor [Pseudoalteromonas sp. MEBiC 03607]TGV20396.1 response regulator transcription factor [Pseudoalteromonas sp. MEBiC 03607]
MSKPCVILVEDDPEISRLMQMYFLTEGFESIAVDNGAKALSIIKEKTPNLVLLDLMLPGMSGSDICSELRTFYNGPIIVLTACDDDMSEVSLLKLGADDYITKPVRPHILMARIEAVFRRFKQSPHSTHNSNDELKIGSLSINLKIHRATLHNEELQLSQTEFEMLILLAKNAGSVVSRKECCKLLRGIELGYNDRSIDMRISGLRKKLRDNHPPYKLIHTIRNKGYMIRNE